MNKSYRIIHFSENLFEIYSSSVSTLIIYCPRNSTLDTGCIVDIRHNGYMEDVYIDTLHGIPADLMIYGDDDDSYG